MHYQFNNSVNYLLLANILSVLTFCCLQGNQKNLSLNKKINLGVKGHRGGGGQQNIRGQVPNQFSSLEVKYDIFRQGHEGTW